MPPVRSAQLLQPAERRHGARPIDATPVSAGAGLHKLGRPDVDGLRAVDYTWGAQDMAEVATVFLPPVVKDPHDQHCHQTYNVPVDKVAVF